MRCLILFATVLCLGLFSGSAAVADDASDIKQAIPADAAMMRADFEKLATSSSVPSASKVQDKSLTLMLLDLKVKDTKKAREQFRFLTDNYPQPSTLSEELYRERHTGKRRVLLEPVTFIHADRITDFTCKVTGDEAAGTVSFKVPELYQGKIEYVAQRHSGKWFISEFIMSAYDIFLVHTNDGHWKEK